VSKNGVNRGGVNRGGLKGSPFLMREETNLLFFFLMFFGASIFPFLISSEAFFTIGGFRCIT